MRNHRLELSAAVVLAAVTGPLAIAQNTVHAPERTAGVSDRTTTQTPPALSETEKEAVFVTAINAERRYRERLGRLRHLRVIARENRDQRRIHELEQLMDDNQRRHERRIDRLVELLDGAERWNLEEAVSHGRTDRIDWSPRQPSVAETTVGRQLRQALESHDATLASLADTLRDDRKATRAAERRERALKRATRNPRLVALRPELRRHLDRLDHQEQVDADARDHVSAATAEAEYQLMRQAIATAR